MLTHAGAYVKKQLSVAKACKQALAWISYLAGDATAQARKHTSWGVLHCEEAQAGLGQPLGSTSRT